MYKQVTIVSNETGIHARPATEFVTLAKKFQSDISVSRVGDSSAANAKSVVRILAAGLKRGTEIEISAEGSDEKEAVDALIQLVESGFGE